MLLIKSPWKKNVHITTDQAIVPKWPVKFVQMRWYHMDLESRNNLKNKILIARLSSTFIEELNYNNGRL